MLAQYLGAFTEYMTMAMTRILIMTTINVQLGHYMLAQYLGAFLGAALVFFTYKVNASEHIINFHFQVGIVIFVLMI